MPTNDRHVLASRLALLVVAGAGAANARAQWTVVNLRMYTVT